MNPQQRREQQTAQIKANQLKTDKNELGWMAAIAISSFLFIVAVGWFEYRTHSIDECQDACFEKLTGDKAPKGVHDENKGE